MEGSEPEAWSLGLDSWNTRRRRFQDWSYLLNQTLLEKARLVRLLEPTSRDRLQSETASFRLHCMKQYLAF